MNQDLQELVIDALEGVKAKDIVALDVSGLSDVMDTMIVASGTSNRH
ncbi:MAG: RsfS/YbeB/iojap family protein, partial [Porticoccaceae bacterium]|nr:RsfS/YbeB/iojap family protein [Porticoccaceae bacterium]